MKNLSITIVLAIFAAAFASCNQNKTQDSADVDSLQVSVLDTAVYGHCGDGTSMHVVQLINDEGTTTEYSIDEDSEDIVKGGLLAGDLLTVTFSEIDGAKVADKVINLTTLLGRWTSLDRNFEIHEDGSVTSNVSAESHPYAAWTMVNGNLVLNTDTFSVVALGADSLSLENDKGIFVYKRLK